MKERREGRGREESRGGGAKKESREAKGGKQRGNRKRDETIVCPNTHNTNKDTTAG